MEKWRFPCKNKGFVDFDFADVCMCDLCDVLHTPYRYEYIYKIVIYTFLRMRGMEKPSHTSHNRKKQLENPVKSMVSEV